MHDKRALSSTSPLQLSSPGRGHPEMENKHSTLCGVRERESPRLLRGIMSEMLVAKKGEIFGFANIYSAVQVLTTIALDFRCWGSIFPSPLVLNVGSKIFLRKLKLRCITRN
uniref:(northern house mosquito) hypothetical protein n=1 Tax=Culex pipiens TaxID=7175 RepID=A0A8D8MT60_CULPI